MTQECKTCENNFNILCTDGNCFYCFTYKHGRSPTQKEYGNPNVKGDKDKK